MNTSKSSIEFVNEECGANVDITSNEVVNVYKLSCAAAKWAISLGEMSLAERALLIRKEMTVVNKAKQKVWFESLYDVTNAIRVFTDAYADEKVAATQFAKFVEFSQTYDFGGLEWLALDTQPYSRMAYKAINKNLLV